MDVEGAAATVGAGAGVGGKRAGAGRWLVGDLAVSRRRDGMEMKSPLVDGLLSDWDQVEKLWEHAFHQRLRAVPSERPVLCAEASWSTAKERRSLMELMFEKFGVPAMFPAKNAMLSAFSAGRATALAKGIEVRPRYALQRGTGDSGVAAAAAAAVAATPALKGKGKGKGKGEGGGGLSVEKLFPETTSSYTTFMRLEIVRELKLTDDLRNLPDLLLETSAMTPLQSSQKDNLSLDLPLPALLRRALEKSDADARKEMVGNVVLTGGGSLFEGMPERITAELTASLPSAFKVRTLTASSIERRFSVWIGGSILCSLGTFQQLWLSKRQYEEQGAEMAETRRFQG
eukprot:jgi/Undpi1/2593/HiC_scaffold_13.g05972.m1